MPLNKRLKREIPADWQEYCFPYKTLQRKAEDLVGEANEEDEAVLKNQISCAIECANTFYKLRLMEISEEFSSLRGTIRTLYDLHSDLELKKSIEMPVKQNIAHSEVCCDDCHPTRSEKARGKVLGRVLAGEDSTGLLRSVFNAWYWAPHERMQASNTLGDFIGSTCLFKVQEGVLKGVLERWLRLLSQIDCLRSFSLLNAIAIKKVLERHCTQHINDISYNLNDCPIIEMKGLSDIIADMEQVAVDLIVLLATDLEVKQAFPETWTQTLCPYCSHAVLNPILLPGGCGGRKACWLCLLQRSNCCLVPCPHTSSKEIDLRLIHVDGMLGNFLQCFFPNVLVGLKRKEKKEEEARDVHEASGGILSVLHSLSHPQPSTLPSHVKRSNSRHAQLDEHHFRQSLDDTVEHVIEQMSEVTLEISNFKGR
mmetsp:Transcript_11523/g.26354  ORF Transcript_11523/g.26354 Transcript_11523/m.26354 type:complete len:425 (-) Transcript_11523:1826-3100(-)